MTNAHPIEHPTSLKALRDALRQFAAERDWISFILLRIWPSP